MPWFSLQIQTLMARYVEYEKSVYTIRDWTAHGNSSQPFPYCDLSYSPIMLLDSFVIQSCSKGSVGLTGNSGASGLYSGGFDRG